MTIDYSKFNAIQDSDDEKEEVKKEPAKAEAVKPHCHNCHKDISKPLRCGVCKKVEYCSAQCQKEDWQYHKRTCKKPEEKKADEKPPPRPKEKKEDKRKKEEVVKDDGDDDEKLDWYRHREWKPTAEPKKDFTPTQITDAAQHSAVAASKPTAGSEWNAAGTWEDKDVTTMAKQTLKEQLEGLPSVDAAGGAISVTSIDDVDGDASKPVIRGKLRHLFDMSFKVKVAFQWMDASGQRKLEGEVVVSDFTNDVFTEGVESEPVVQLTLKEAGALDMGRKGAIEDGVGSGAWPPKAGTLMAHVAARMRAWADKYQQAA